jgi:hypothetical protein
MQNLLSNSLTNSADFNQSGTIVHVNCIYVVVGKDPSTSIKSVLKQQQNT